MRAESMLSAELEPATIISRGPGALYRRCIFTNTPAPYASGSRLRIRIQAQISAMSMTQRNISMTNRLTAGFLSCISVLEINKWNSSCELTENKYGDCEYRIK